MSAPVADRPLMVTSARGWSSGADYDAHLHIPTAASPR
jgi:hypothetical protein